MAGGEVPSHTGVWACRILSLSSAGGLWTPENLLAPVKWVVPGAESLQCAKPLSPFPSFSAQVEFSLHLCPTFTSSLPAFYRKAPGRAVCLGVSECVPALVCTHGMQKVMQRVSWMEPPPRPQEVSTIIGLSGSTDPLLQEALPDLPFSQGEVQTLLWTQAAPSSPGGSGRLGLCLPLHGGISAFF